jgi:aminoglycoside phosphotransferase (APT) family kinase protein
MDRLPSDGDVDAPPGGGPAAALVVDVVDTWAEARGRATPPLVVREGLAKALGVTELPEVERVDAGHSNPTFRVRSAEDHLILRRPPRPPFAPKAHDVLREHRMLTALRDEPVRTPVPVLACADPAVIGAPFYLMEALDGLVLRGDSPAPLDSPPERRRAGEELVDALAELHAVDATASGAGDPAGGEGYLRRQLALWSAQWERRASPRRVAAVDDLARDLRRTLPRPPSRFSVVHGDYKLDNVLYAPTAPYGLIAILDWEMATIGDPLADLGYLTATWIDPDEDPARAAGLSSVTAWPGFPSRHALADRYADATGLPLDQLAWYQALALWKLAILLESSYQRFLAGTATDPFFATLEEGVPRIAEQALDARAGALL